ncbi:CGNR zinc finger domain-containing protein [Rathayibacter sp. VKM Ac-2878]|nr:CGNR zinc finger domain-containing protein [Rathayibacter sp. VKM Ac-2879]MBF4502975.1 CGNR zinc finger domain-containing protein [Rathayibacter sp. VKM Ac-2878]
MAEDDGHRWWFDSGSLALDFAHTGAFASGREALDSDEALSAWLADRFDVVDPSTRDARLDDALMLRAAIAHLVEAAEGGTSADPRQVDVLNLFAALPDIPPVLGGGSRQAGRSNAGARHALSAIAREAVTLLGSSAADRLRRCDDEQCRLLYLDTSRARSRRWCSMQRCGNRSKVRAHRQRAAAVRAD